MSADPRPPVVSLPTPSFESGAGIDIASIKRQSIRGGAITFVTQGANIAIQLTSTLVLARLLKPTDYGIVAMVMAVTGFAGLFRDLGLSSAIIQRDKLTHEQLSTIYWINVALGALLTVVVASMSPLVGWFYGRPELNMVTAIVSLSFIIGSFGAQPGALLTRKMLFGRLAVAQLAGALVGLTVSIVMALNGFSYWALVVGALAGGIITTILLNSLCGWRPGVAVRGAGVRSLLKYGASITAFDIVNYFQRNLDNILLGRFWGADALGLYSRAYALLMFPIQNIRGPINAVAFPAMSRLQNQPDLLRAYYVRVTSLLAFISMPVAALLFVISKPLIDLLLGPAWSGVAPIFSFLAVAAFIQPTSGLAGSLLLSMGRSRRYFECGFFNAIVFSASFVAGLPWGPMGVALCYAIANYIVLIPWLAWAFRDTPVGLPDFFRAILYPAVATFCAAALMIGVEQAVDYPSVVMQLLMQSAIFFVAFILFMSARRQGRAQLTELLGIVRTGWSATLER